MGGDITVRSQLRVGSQFCLNIPLPETAPMQEPSEQFDNSGPRLSGVRVLAADDVELNRLVLDDMLIQEGAQVVFAENGQQVLERLREIGVSGIDVVLMDIQMPLMDGYQAAKKVLEIAPDLPVIGLTAHAMPEERLRCLEAGMRERVTKPVDVDQLVSIILKNLPHKPLIQPISQHDAEPVAAVDTQIQPESAEEPVAKSKPTDLIDWATVLQRFEGRQAFVDRLIDSALDGTQHSNADKLRQAAQDQDLATIKFVAHSVKGFAGVFQVHVLFDQAQAIEQAVKNQDANVLDKVDSLADCLLGVLQELQQYKNVNNHHES
jgi:CheY-like chemotaxis protein